MACINVPALHDGGNPYLPVPGRVVAGLAAQMPPLVHLINWSEGDTSFERRGRSLSVASRSGTGTGCELRREELLPDLLHFIHQLFVLSGKDLLRLRKHFCWILPKWPILTR
jgi:hypothetical protein